MTNPFSNPFFKWTQTESKAENIFSKILKQQIEELPQNFYSKHLIAYLSKAQSTQLYHLLHSMPKGVMHHNHYICNEDTQFVQKIVEREFDNVFFNEERSEIKIGTIQEAQNGNWASIKDLKNKGEDPAKIFNSLLFFKQQQIDEHCGQKSAWPLFQEKIDNVVPLLQHQEIAQLYFKHVCEKYQRNGYNRLQFRIIPQKLISFQQNKATINSRRNFRQIYRRVLQQINSSQKSERISVGFIMVGFKVVPKDKTMETWQDIMSNFEDIVGIDYVQEEDLYGSLEPYDKIVDQFLQKYKKISKVYHAGQTIKQQNDNVEIAIKAGSVRIGHGINILSKKYLNSISQMQITKKPCFEFCPVSNVFLGYVEDPRNAIAPKIFDLGIPLTINPDDPSKFGYKDSTFDYFVSSVSYNWSLKHFKMLGYYSILYALCSEEEKKQLISTFQEKWNKWINAFFDKTG